MSYSPQYANAAGLVYPLLEYLEPPKRLTVSEAAQLHCFAISSSGAAKPYNAELTPYMIEPMNTTLSRKHKTVCFVGPARSSKTLSLVDAVYSHAVTCNPGDMLIIFSTRDLAKDYSYRRLKRLQKVSPVINEQLNDCSWFNGTLQTLHKNGMITTLGWPTSSQVAQRDIKIAIACDYDSSPTSIDGEGELYQLLLKRIETYLSSGICIVEGSPKRPIVDPSYMLKTPHDVPATDGGLVSIYSRSDRRRWYWRCFECKEYFEAPPVPHYDTNVSLQQAVASCFVPCPHCGAVYRSSEKVKLNKYGKWIPDTNPDGSPIISDIAGFMMFGCAARFQSWESILTNYLRAIDVLNKTGSEEALKATCNIDQGISYTPKAMTSTRTEADLIAKQELIDQGSVPEGVRFLVAAVDVQGRRFVVSVIGIGIGMEKWVIDRFDIAVSNRRLPSGEFDLINPHTHNADWMLLVDKVYRKAYPLADGSNRAMPIRMMGVDSGGKAGVTPQAYAFWRAVAKIQRLGESIRLLKGRGVSMTGGGIQIPRVQETFPDLADQQKKSRKLQARLLGEVPVLQLNSNLLKDSIMAGLDRIDWGPTYIHLPAWLPTNNLRELLAEVRTVKGWRQISAQNEMLDLLCYAEALSIYLKCENWGETWERCPPWAAEWDKNPTLIPFDDSTPRTQYVSKPKTKVQHHTVYDTDLAPPEWYL